MDDGRWYGWIADRWDTLRGSYWFFPAQMALASGIVALGVVELDRRLPAGWGESLPWLTKVSAEGARAVLTTIAGSMMTVTSVVFSITVVALTLTSSQFGPRLLRTFFRDRASQVALGTFIATFCYSLLVLRAVETPERVPYIATAGAVALAVASLFVLIFFVHHAASSIQASSVIAAVTQELREQLPTLFPEALGQAADPEPDAETRRRIERLESEGREVASQRDGYVRVVDDQGLLKLARALGLLVRLEARPGDFVGAGAPLARVLAGDDPEPRDDEEILEAVRRCWVVGDHRTPVQDIRFLTNQLAEMAVRALSPGVNDPQTAVACVERLGSVVAQLADRAMPSGLRYDEDGTLRAVAEPERFEAIAGSCFDAVRHHGAHDPQVATALLGAVATGVRCCTHPDRVAALAEHAREIRDGFDAAQKGSSRRDRARVNEAWERVAEEIARSSTAPAGNS